MPACGKHTSLFITAGSEVTDHEEQEERHKSEPKPMPLKRPGTFSPPIRLTAHTQFVTFSLLSVFGLELCVVSRNVGVWGNVEVYIHYCIVELYRLLFVYAFCL